MNKLNVHLDFGDVSHFLGTLYLSEKLGRHVFSYEKNFLRTGLEISPRTMPLGSSTFVAERNKDLYDLPGVFADSLPDEWGRKVQDAEFQKIGRQEVTPLERLAFVGQYGIGALRYEPAQEFESGKNAVRLADLRKAVQRILSGKVDEVNRDLFRSGGSAGGARPKFLVDLNTASQNDIRYTRGKPEKDWFPVILKTPVKENDQYQRIEYAYTRMAREAGIQMPETFLLAGGKSKLAYFAIKRFDVRQDGTRLHVHTLAGLLGINFREAVPDYTALLRVTGDLTRDHRNVREAYRRMVFNYLGSNKDDHAKNFSFVMDAAGAWSLSPAYDIGYSSAENNLHAMALNGKRSNLTARDLAKAAEDFDIHDWRPITEQVIDSLGQWPGRAEKSGISRQTAKAIGERIREHTARVKKEL